MKYKKPIIYSIIILSLCGFLSAEIKAESNTNKSYRPVMEAIKKEDNKYKYDYKTPPVLGAMPSKKAKYKIWMRDKVLSYLSADMWMGEPVTAVVRVFLEKNGEIRKVLSRGTSGNDRLDNDLINAVYKAGPFGAIPNSMKRDMSGAGVILEFLFTGKTVEAKQFAYEEYYEK